MAKRKSSAMVCPPCGPRCIGMGLLSGVFAALGLWMIVAGFQMQSAGVPWLNAALWYFGGFVLWAICKKCKQATCATC